MCTVSWLHHEGGYRLFSNRDEKRARKPARPPALQTLRGVRFLAPIDGDAGGTWIGVNQFGLSLCLLNRYQDDASMTGAGSWTSRGRLVLDLLDAATTQEARDRAAAADLAAYRPFTLLALEPGTPARLLHWTGRECRLLDDAEHEMPLTSSSFDLPGVLAARSEHFARLRAEHGRIDEPLLRRFHASHLPAPSAYSTCMHREDAQTVSFTAIAVSPDGIHLAYRPHAPCAGDDAEVRLHLPE